MAAHATGMHAHDGDVYLQTTIRAAAGLIKSGLTDPKAVKETDFKAKIDALNSEGNVQRGKLLQSGFGLLLRFG